MTCCNTDKSGGLLNVIPDEVVEEMCQLVKANSIEGCKKSSVRVVFTPHSNLHKDPNTMKDGAVGFHSPAFRRFRLVEKDRGLVNKLNKTKTEAYPDLQHEKREFEKRVTAFEKVRTKAEREARVAEESAIANAALEKQQQYEAFLSSGGYHARTPTAAPPGVDEGESDTAELGGPSSTAVDAPSNGAGANDHCDREGSNWWAEARDR